MAIAAIVYENLFDAAEVMASSSILRAPVSLLQDPHISRRWRGTGGETDYFIATIVGDFNTVALFGLTGTAPTVRIRVSSTDTSGLSGDLYDSGSLVVDTDYQSLIRLLPAALTGGGILRVDITDAGAAYVEAGRCVVGLRTSFSINFDWNWTRQWTDRSARAKTRGGQTQVLEDVSYRTISVTFSNLLQSEVNGVVETMDRVNGLHRDILFITDPDSTNLARDSVWGLVTDMTPVANAFLDRFSKSYTVEERL